MDKSDKLFTRDYFLISILGLLLRFGMFIKMTIQPLYLLELYSSKTIAGLAMTIFTISALVLRPVSGKIIDRYGRKCMFFWGTIMFVLTTLPFGYIDNLLLLYFFQILNGIGFSIQSVADTTMVTDIIPDKRLTEGLGYYGLTATLAQAFGPAVALIFIDTIGFQLGFLMTGLISSLSIILVFFIVYENKQSHIDSKVKSLSAFVSDEKPKKALDMIIERNAAYPSLFMGILAFVSASTATFLIPYAQMTGIENIALYFSARAIGVAVSRLFAGRVTAKYGNFKILILGLICVFIGTAGINIMRNVSMIVIVAFVYGLGFGLCSLLLNVGAVINTAQNERAAANATFYLAMDAGIGIGALTWGVVGDVLGLGNIFIGSALIALTTLIAFTAIRRSKTIFKSNL